MHGALCIRGIDTSIKMTEAELAHGNTSHIPFMYMSHIQKGGACAVMESQYVDIPCICLLGYTSLP